MDAHPVAAQLGHVYWIGGPPDAGKTTVTRLVADACGGLAYHQDRHELDHIRRAVPGQHPLHVAVRDRLHSLSEPAFLDSHWLSASPTELAERARATWHERVDLVCEDLLRLPKDVPVIAEGPGFFPATILPFVAEPHHAAWLLPTETFKRASHARRDKSAFAAATSNPDLARANHMARDIALMASYEADLRAHDIQPIIIDGTRTPADIANALLLRFRLTKQRL